MSAEWTTAADGLASPETPVLLDDGGWLLVEMAIGRAGVSRISAGKTVATQILPVGRPNGVAIDATRALWIADTDPPRLHRATLGGELVLSVDRLAGVPLLFPNDLCFGPDGALYMTDSGVLLSEWAPGGALIDDWRSVRTAGRVLRVDPCSFETTCLGDGLRFPNGIAVGTDGHVYVNEMLTGAVYRYLTHHDGTFEQGELFGQVPAAGPEGPFLGPDGMAFSDDGRLWVTIFGGGEVVTLDTSGSVVGRRSTGGQQPTNCAFGVRGSRALYVTEAEHGRLERHEVGVDGAAIHHGGALDDQTSLRK